MRASVHFVDGVQENTKTAAIEVGLDAMNRFHGRQDFGAHQRTRLRALNAVIASRRSCSSFALGSSGNVGPTNTAK